MKVRELRPEEYDRLSKIEEGFVPNPETSRVVVAEDTDGNIIGRWMLVVMPHIEGCWVAPDARNGFVAHRMERELCRIAKELDLPEMLAYTTNEKHTEYMKRLGWKDTGFTVLKKRLEDT